MDIKKEMLDALAKRNKDEFNLYEDLVVSGVDLGKMRSMIGYRGIDIASFISTDEIDINNVKVYVYNKESTSNYVLFYLHGGGFYGGSAKVVEFACKYMAYKGNFTVYNIDYTLAPAKKFPNIALEILDVVKEISSKYENTIFGIAGDSAGGHLAINVAQLDTQKIISKVMSFYPVISLEAIENWSINMYNLDEDAVHAKATIQFLRSIMKYINLFYVPSNIDKRSSLYNINNMSYEEFDKLAEIYIYKAQFDYFNIEIDRLIKKFNIKSREYKGVSHGFIELIGYVDEASLLLERAVLDFLE